MNKSSPGRPYLTMRSLCLSLLVGAILPSSSLGYPGPNDPKRWPGNSITYNIDPVSFPVNSNRETLILNALYGWDYETFAGTSFGTYYWAPPYGRTADNNNDTTNTIGFTSNISDIQVLAVTSWRANASNQYLEADIAINRFVNWDSPALPDSGPPYNVFSLENVVRHEAGHGAGFRGEESRKPRVATMNPVYSWGGSAYSNLHGDDRNGLRTFYPTSGDDHDVRVMGWALDDFGQTDTVPAPHPQYLSSKQNITVTYTVENLGTVSYQDSLDFYLSIFPNIDPSFDTKIGTTAVSLPAAKGGDAIVPILTTSRTVTIPCGVSGTNYIGAFARYPSDDNTGDNVSVFQTQEHPYPLAITDLSPDEPILVSATTELCDRVHITWQDVSSDETGFRIYRNSQHIGTALANASSFDDFPAAGTYTYGVTAVNTVCESDTGKAAGIRRTAPTAAPTSITGTSNRCDGILVAWAWGSSSPAGFKVYRDTETLPVYTGTTPSETNWLDSGASPGGHSYQVAAYNSCGTGPKSSSASGQRLTPSSTVATPSSTSDRCDGILVEWLWGGSGQTAFYVFRDNAGTPTFTAVATARTWLDASASPGSHEYTIQAIYAGNCFGPVSSITTGVRLGPPTSSPSFLTATDYLCNVVALAWNYSGSNHSGFQVLRNGTQITAIADPGARSYDDATAVQGVTYSYKVHAYNGCGPGADSNQDAGTRQSSPPAQTPSSVAASDGGFCCTQTLVTWGWASDGHQGFRVLRDGVTIFSGTDANQRQWADVGGSAGVTYSYSVLAYNGCGNGPVSSGDPGTRCSPTFFGPNPISVATVGPDAGYKESIVPDGSGGVIVAWSDKRNGTDYNVYAQHVNSAGTICWTTGGVPVETAPGDQVNVDMVSDGFGGAFLVWEDGR